MSRYDYDLFVIGGGSGGVRAARISAEFGARVALCEERWLGGTCVNVGCVPKKLLVYGSEMAHDFASAAGYGWTVQTPQFNWRTLIENKNREIERLNGVYEGLLERAGVAYVHGRGVLQDAHTVEVEGRRYTAEHILVATGSWPFVPDIPGKEHVITSNEAFYLPQMPRRVVIAGGGFIAAEFAGIFNGFGAEATLVYRGPLFLRGFDDDTRTFLADEMRKKHIDLRFETTLTRIDKEGEGLRVTFSDGRVEQTDIVMCATGRVANTRGLGLENAGVETAGNGALMVDAYFRTNVPSVLALGDVIDRVPLTPVAIAEGMALARTLFASQPTTVDYSNIPSTVFSQPNLGKVGLTESDARELHKSVTVYKTNFRPMKHTLTGDTERTFMKLVVDGESDRVLGVHMVGPEAGETIQGFAVALKAGATKADFDATVGIHPTAAEEFVTMRTPAAPPPGEKKAG